MSNTELEVPLFPLKYAIARIEIDFFVWIRSFFFVCFGARKLPRALWTSPRRLKIPCSWPKSQKNRQRRTKNALQLTKKA
jgi:hypothetical protein